MVASVQTLSFLMFCFVLVSALSSADLQTLKSLDQFAQSSHSRDTDIMILAICWDGQAFIDECQKHKGLIQQLLYKLLSKLKTQTRISDNDEEEQDQRIPLKNRRDDASGFYSNW
ncbi:hypothetical protein Bpfe_002683 [Biomphalaria pfeifferi]|uniref:Uncharacterized protein n=1 Tax=Biomphalaria pfeifferi TaxID=112525 RepID=A0AAD8C7G0_BIOPF|nr:hypothetical protein Bpfe_002683 [Biomphalaria pfeifferi]